MTLIVWVYFFRVKHKIELHFAGVMICWGKTIPDLKVVVPCLGYSGKVDKLGGHGCTLKTFLRLTIIKSRINRPLPWRNYKKKLPTHAYRIVFTYTHAYIPDSFNAYTHAYIQDSFYTCTNAYRIVFIHTSIIGTSPVLVCAKILPRGD